MILPTFDIGEKGEGVWIYFTVVSITPVQTGNKHFLGYFVALLPFGWGVFLTNVKKTAKCRFLGG